MQPSPLEFTGERFTPECVREIWYEHLHRYAFARAFARGRRVLDAACGEGYGSALLAELADRVVGVDISPQAIEHARGRYAARANLMFEQADAVAFVARPAEQFDLVVSFETLEHLAEQEALLDGFARALAPEGVLLISTPDKLHYSEQPGTSNPFHVRELYREEFEEMLRARFAHVTLFAQKLLFQSVLWRPDGIGEAAGCTEHAGKLEDGLTYPPLYWIAVCSHQPIDPNSLPSMHLFGDKAESVYRHYEHEIRKNMSAGARIQELEAEVDALRARLAAAGLTG